MIYLLSISNKISARRKVVLIGGPKSPLFVFKSICYILVLL